MRNYWRRAMLTCAYILLAGCGGSEPNTPAALPAPISIPVGNSEPNISSPALSASPGPAISPVQTIPPVASPASLNLPPKIIINGTSYDTAYAVSSGHFQYDPIVQTFTALPGSAGWSGDTANGNERVELVTSNVLTHSLIYPFYENVWLSYAFVVEKGDPITASWNILGQFHDWHDDADMGGLSPPLSFVMDPSTGDVLKMSLWTRSDANPSTQAQVKPLRRWQGTFRRGEWINVVLRARPGYKDDGQLQLWINGKLALDAIDINFGYNNPTGFGYWQYGIYRPVSKDVVTVKYANMEQSRESLLQRVTSPLNVK